MSTMLRTMTTGIAVVCAGVSCAQPVPSDGAEAPVGSGTGLGAVQVAWPATSAGHTAPVDSDIDLGPITSTTSTAATTTVAEVIVDEHAAEPDEDTASDSDTASSSELSSSATTEPAPDAQDDTAGAIGQVPPQAPNTHLPSAPFRGIVHTHWSYVWGAGEAPPRLLLFDTARAELTETELDPGEFGPAPVFVEGCLMWPVVSPVGVELWFYGIQITGNGGRQIGRVVSAAPWGGPMVVHTSDRSDWDFQYASFGTAAAYGNEQIELTADSGGFTLTLGSQQAHFDLNPGRPAGAPPTTLDPDYRPEVEGGWLSWLAGTNGEFVAVEAFDGHACGWPNRLYIISLRTGTVVSCTSSFDRFTLVATADANDTEVWLEDAQLPPSANLSGMPCEPYDGNLAALVAPGSSGVSGSSSESDNETSDTQP
ncbi:hypothetical protein [Candidatus Poriferisodalis sp.]|uniref:hypothetical protein n=1 Tax=Candidatus Poriferisodalis sp. TaxID=3101277 RepID=UPI003C6FC447